MQTNPSGLLAGYKKSFLESFLPPSNGALPPNVVIPYDIDIENEYTIEKASDIANQIGDTLMHAKFSQVANDYMEYQSIADSYLKQVEAHRGTQSQDSLDRIRIEQNIQAQQMQEKVATLLYSSLNIPIGKILNQ